MLSEHVSCTAILHHGVKIFVVVVVDAKVDELSWVEALIDVELVVLGAVGVSAIVKVVDCNVVDVVVVAVAALVVSLAVNPDVIVLLMLTTSAVDVVS